MVNKAFKWMCIQSDWITFCNDEFMFESYFLCQDYINGEIVKCQMNDNTNLKKNNQCLSHSIEITGVQKKCIVEMLIVNEIDEDI